MEPILRPAERRRRPGGSHLLHRLQDDRRAARFPADFPAPEVAIGLIGGLLARDGRLRRDGRN